MKKLFLLFPLFVFSLLANAKILDIAPNSPQSSDNVRREIRDHISAGDTLRLADGTYSESEVILFDKSVTLIAAEGAHPVIAQHYYSEITSGAKVKIVGVKFDGSLYNSGAGANDHCFCPYDASEGNELRFENCEFKSFKSRFIYIPAGYKLDTCIIKNTKFSAANSVIYNSSASVKYLKIDGCEVSGITEYAIYAASSKSHMDSCIVNNCYFHNNEKSVIFFTASTIEGTETCDGVIVKNSTFANNDISASDGSVIEVRNFNSTVASNIEVTVDHCTFYNNPTSAEGYAGVRSYKSTKVNISNCIFAHPTSYTHYATYCYGGNITNCLVYNINKGTNGHRQSSGQPVLSGNFTANPLFTDAASGDFSYAGTYPSNFSPARGAGTDGSDLGDPRWYTPAVYPSTNFAAPGYYCAADDAILSGSASSSSFNLQSETEPHYIAWSEVYPYTAALATWKITATRACYITVSLDLGPAISSNKHIFEVKILDANNNPVGTLAEGEVDPEGDTENNTEANQIKTFDGSIVIPQAGNYTIELRNIRGYGKGSIKNVILTYDGDAPITDFSAPGYTFLAKRATLEGNIEYNTTTATPYIRYMDKSDPGTASWSVTATRACQVKVAMNMVDNSAYSNGNGKHRFVVELLDENEDVKSYVEEPSEVDENGRSFPRSYDMPGCITIPEAGDYTIRLRNPRDHSRCGLASITLTYTYEGGNVVDIPNAEIPLEDAILTNATRDAEGLHFKGESQYVEWNINAAKGVYEFAANCNSSNYSNLKITIKDSQSNTVYTQQPEYSYSGTKEIKFSNVVLTAGSYTVKLENPTAGSGYVTSLSATADETIFLIDENATDGSYIVEGISGKNPLLNRTFRAGMYNTICVPFDSYNSELQSIFGTDYELLELESANLSGDVLDLNFTVIAHDGSNFAAGKPYLIKPTQDVTNPKFNTHTIHNYTYNNTKSCTNANFVGSFIKGTIPASEDNLFLGANDMLYFPTGDTEIKGTRAYFQVHDAPAGAVRRARIIQQGQVVTELELVNGEWVDAHPNANGTLKTIENGQLILISNGIRYNVIGQRVK